MPVEGKSRPKRRRGSATARLVRSLHRNGLSRTLRLLAKAVGNRASQALLLDETHIWYARPLGRDQDGRDLPPELELVSVTPEAIGLLLDTPFPDNATAELVLAQDEAAAWALVGGGRTLFSCWTFTSRVPAIQAVGGWMDLPAGVSFLENSVASPDQRGRHLLSMTLDSICTRLLAAGQVELLTKVRDENVPARKATERSGFEEIARTRFRRIAGRRHLRIEVRDRNAAWLGTALTRPL
jgi:hypothetical protein